MSYDYGDRNYDPDCNHEFDEEGTCYGCGYSEGYREPLLRDGSDAYYDRFSEAIDEHPLGRMRQAPEPTYQLFDIDGYGEFVDEIWLNDGPLTDRDFRIMELGLPGEVGEVLELLKKHVRDGTLDRNQLKKELGDVAYYWARICSAYGFKPSEVIHANVEKLSSRLQRNTLRGSGNDR